MNKIAIFSTSSRAIGVIEEISKAFEISLIVTKTDKVIGRKKELVSNEVKKFAQLKNIPFIEIEKFDLTKKEEVIKSIQNLRIPFGLSIDFGFIIPKTIFGLNNFKIINTHFSLLPKYRGASAVQFAILNDDKNFGITYHLIDATLDTGDILYTSTYPLEENFNSEQGYKFLFDKCKSEINDVLIKFVENKLIPQKQEELKASYTYSTSNPKYTFIFKEDALLDDKDSERKVFRKIKAYNPWPLLHTSVDKILRFKQFNNYQLKSEDFKKVLIKINDADYTDNALRIKEITVINGKKLNINDFINGYFKKK